MFSRILLKRRVKVGDELDCCQLSVELKSIRIYYMI